MNFKEHWRGAEMNQNKNYWNDHDKRFTILVRRIEELENALCESLKFQSHYAKLLNDHDGGKRKEFKTNDEWIKAMLGGSCDWKPDTMDKVVDLFDGISKK
jgi:hypothetical protein